MALGRFFYKNPYKILKNTKNIRNFTGIALTRPSKTAILCKVHPNGGTLAGRCDETLC